MKYFFLKHTSSIHFVNETTMASLIHMHAFFILIGRTHLSLCQNVSTDYYDYGFPSQNETDCSEDNAGCIGNDTFVLGVGVTTTKGGMLQ